MTVNEDKSEEIIYVIKISSSYLKLWHEHFECIKKNMQEGKFLEFTQETYYKVV